MTTPKTIPEAAKELVERSRAGDQNATAMIVQVRKGAQKGNRRAVETVKALKQYIESNPNHAKVVAGKTLDGHDAIAELKQYCSFGSEAPRTIRTFQKKGSLSLMLLAACCSVYAVAGTLVNDGPLTPAIIQSMATKMADPSAGNVFLLSVTHYRHVDRLQAWVEKDARCLGHVLAGAAVGYARDIQAARDGNIKALSEMAAWELGD